MSTPTVREEIVAFLASQGIAVVGVARDPNEFSQRLYADLRRWGYDAVPVTPHLAAVGGTRAFARVQDIDTKVESALLLTAPGLNDQLVRDCAEAGIQRVWFYGVSDRSSENAAAIAYCRQQGMSVVPGYCPYMFLPRAPFFHRIHGFVARLTGQYPH